MQGRPMSSLPLQIIIYFDNIYTAIYWVLEIMIYVYKGSNFLYPPHALGSEISAVSFLALLQYFRLFTGINHEGSVGNKTEGLGAMAWFLLLSCPSLIGCVYFIRLQTYVLVADVIVNTIFLFFLGLEVILSFVTIIKFKGAQKAR